MKKENNETPFTSTMRLQSSSRFQHRKVDGVFFMNIYKPTPLPVIYCDLQIAELELRKLYEDYRRINGLITLLQCEYLCMKLDLQIIYYQQCKKLTLKGQKQ